MNHLINASCSYDLTTPNGTAMGLTLEQLQGRISKMPFDMRVKSNVDAFTPNAPHALYMGNFQVPHFRGESFEVINEEGETAYSGEMYEEALAAFEEDENGLIHAVGNYYPPHIDENEPIPFLTLEEFHALREQYLGS